MESPLISARALPALGGNEGLPTAGTASSGPVRANSPATSTKIDLHGMEPPKILSQARIEDLTIDGICGVY